VQSDDKYETVRQNIARTNVIILDEVKTIEYTVYHVTVFIFGAPMAVHLAWGSQDEPLSI
jgi:hypothetical protein